MSKLSFTIATKRIKYLGKKLTRDVKEPFQKELEKTTMNFIWNQKRACIAKSILSKKNTVGASHYKISNYTTRLQ